ncbi:VPLPA-CTERM sorting domain-containing protein [Antarctobacter jejuensis]|uniref:VPLPA-CTERM sorting domain-containing protein n=1 Tax=Antarctobacter jejuensis TaxID=1439938 RepID=UPI003FD1CFF5
MFNKYLKSVAAAILLSAGAAGADTIDFGGSKYGGYEAVNTNLRGNVLAGEFAMFNVDKSESFFAYCINVLANIKDSDYEVFMPAVPVMEGLTDLYNAHYDSVVDKSTSAAFQLAVWEIFHETDTTYALDAGFFQSVGTNQTAIDQASDWLATMDGAPSKYQLSYWDSDNTLGLRQSQDLVTASPIPSPVPLPAAGWMLLAALGGGALLRRRARG